MLIGTASKKPNIETVRRIKRAIHEALQLSDEATVTVAQLTCLEEDCAPLETVIGLLRPGSAQLQHKVHKETNALDANDLAEVCEAWGYKVETSIFKSILKEN